MAKGILIAAFDFSNAHSDEFHDWYDLEHLPEREAVPGFGACRRWIGGGGNQSVATYDLDTVEVLDSAPYRAIARGNLSVWSKRVTGQCQRLLRFEGVLIGNEDAAAPAVARGLLVNAMNVAPEHEEEFNAWYDEEHLPGLRAVPGTLNAWRYRGRPGSAHRYVAIYYLSDSAVAGSDAWKAAAESEWTERMRPHFRDHVRILSEAYHRPVA